MIRQFLTGTKALLQNRPIVNGQILFPNDSSEVYYDINNVRRKVQGIFYIQSDSDLSGVVNPEEKLYFSASSGMLFFYDSGKQEFVQINRTGIITGNTSSQRTSLEHCAEDSIYVDSDTSELYVGVNINPTGVYWRKIGDNISNYNGQINLRTNNKNILSTDNSGNTTIGESSNSISINAKSFKLNGARENTANGVVVLGSDGYIIPSLIKSNKREDIEFSYSDLSDGKIILSDCYAGDFSVIDNDGKRVFPDEIQSGESVIVDFSSFSVTGTWKIHFRNFRKERVTLKVKLSYLVDKKLTIENCYVGDFSVIDENGSRILPDEQQVGNNIVIDFDGFQDEYVTVIYPVPYDCSNTQHSVGDSNSHSQSVSQEHSNSLSPSSDTLIGYMLSGAGSDEFNGRYDVVEGLEVGGKPVYTHKSTALGYETIAYLYYNSSFARWHLDWDSYTNDFYPAYCTTESNINSEWETISATAPGPSSVVAEIYDN